MSAAQDEHPAATTIPTTNSSESPISQPPAETTKQPPAETTKQLPAETTKQPPSSTEADPQPLKPTLPTSGASEAANSDIPSNKSDASAVSPTKEYKKPAGVVAPAMKPTATISPVVNVTQQHQIHSVPPERSSTAAPSSTTPQHDSITPVSVTAGHVTREPEQQVRVTEQQNTQSAPQFNINISLNTNTPGPISANPGGHQQQHQQQAPNQVSVAQSPPTPAIKQGYFKYPVPFKHAPRCSGCVKIKPPVIDVDKGTKDDPINLDSDSDEDKSSATEKPKSELVSPVKAQSTGTSSQEKPNETPEQAAKRRKLSGTIATTPGTSVGAGGSGTTDGSNKPGQNNVYRIKFNNQTLYFAALKGDVAKVSLLLEGNPDRMNFRVKDSGMTPLHAAVKSGSLEVLKELTRHMGAGTLTLEAMDKELQTPLFYAVRFDKPLCLRFLLTQGVNINARDTNARTALHYACELGSSSCIDMLLADRKIQVDTQDMDGWTALMWACEYKYYDIVMKLLDKKADVLLRDGEKNIALHWAAFSGSDNILKVLLSTGCDIDSTNERGDTALHIASRFGHKECITVLVTAGASIRLLNNAEKMCLDEANAEITQLIKRLEKDRDSRNFVNAKQQRNTILHRDISRGKERVPIPCVNEIDDCPAPLNFVYVKESFESSYLCINRNMNTIRACLCENQCVQTSPCSCFFYTTGHKCVYNKEGRLNTELSDQHNDIVIFECNQRCRCWVNLCTNRVVQKGLHHPLQLFRTKGKGWGVRSPQALVKGTFICEYIGEIISDSDADRRLNDTYLFDLTVVSINSAKDDNKTIGSIDACHFGNISRFINSSCEPNCVPVKVFVDHQDLRFPRIAFFTTKDVTPYEELTFYYGDSFWDIKKEVLKCCCGAPNCISLVSSQDDDGESSSSDVEIID